MNLELDQELQEFFGVVVKAASNTPGDPEGSFRALEGTGVFDLRGNSTSASGGQELATVVAIEAMARGGLAAPMAETLLARGRFPDAVTGWVAAPSLQTRAGMRFLPYGQECTAVLTDTGLITTSDLRPASTPAHPHRHGWMPLTLAPQTFLESEGPVVWRGSAAATLGWLDNILERAVEHAKGREQFGRPLASFQSLQFRLAEVAWRLDGLRLLVYEAAWRADEGDPRADPLSALSWLYGRQVNRLCSRHLQQIFGAIGFTDELGITALTGSLSILRTGVDVADAVTLTMAAREQGDHPPSNILSGFSLTGVSK